jgi:hypothetical protein
VLANQVRLPSGFIAICEARHNLRNRFAYAGAAALTKAARQPVKPLLKLRLHAHGDGHLVGPFNVLYDNPGDCVWCWR